MIATERLILRDWTDADRAPFAAMGADPEVMRYFPSLHDRAESDVGIDRWRAGIAAKGYGLWAVERRSDGAFLGLTGLWDVNFASPIEGDVEIGWRLARHAWKQGYATEAARASLAFGWAHLPVPRIVAMTVPANAPSRAVMERLGMTRRPDLDFDHPRIAPAHPMRAHVVFAINRP